MRNSPENSGAESLRLRAAVALPIRFLLRIRPVDPHIEPLSNFTVGLAGQIQFLDLRKSCTSESYLRHAPLVGYQGMSTDFAITAHSEYIRLGLSAQDRCLHYRELFRADLDAGALKQIRDSTNQSRPLGSERFQQEIEAALSRRVRLAKPVRKKQSVVSDSSEEIQHELRL